MTSRSDIDPAPSSEAALARIWNQAGLDDEQLRQIELPEAAATLPSSFNVGMAAQASIGAAALAAESMYHHRTGVHQQVRVTRRAAELECTGYFKLDGSTPRSWAKFSGLYETGDGFVRIHANFDHHRDGVLALLGLPGADRCAREDLAAALMHWSAEEFEEAAAAAGLVVAMVRSFDTWDKHPQAVATRHAPLVRIRKIGDAPPVQLGAIHEADAPLTGIRVLDLTRILAGPICGRTLAAYGADVLLVNSPGLPNIASIIDTSRGKRSAHIDLKDAAGAETLQHLLRTANVFVQGYRPGALSTLGLSPDHLAQIRPGIVCVSLSAYGNTGPWSERRGFDSLVQTAAGFNHAEAEAAGTPTPKPLPVQILDYASGFLMAFGAQAALLRQQREGGSWQVDVSLLQTSSWLRRMGRLADGLAAQPPALQENLLPFPCSEGQLLGMPHAAELSATPATWRLPSTLPGSHPAEWLG